MGFSKRGVSPSLGLIVLASGAALALAGCQQISNWLGLTDPWAGYYDSTENFIAAHGFDQQDLTTAGYQSNAKWTWAWRGDPDASYGTGFDYMTFAQNTTATPPASLPATTPVYDLQLVNLYPLGGGDFEGATTPLAGWTVGSASSSVTTVTGVAAIHGESIDVATAGNDSVSFNLGSIFDQSYPVTIPHTYNWRFYLSAGSTYAAEVASVFDPTSPASTLAPTVDSTGDVSILDITVNTPTPSLWFGNTSPLSFTMDDVRIFRSDINSDWRLRLLLRPADAVQTLRSGYYEFTVWVKKPTNYYFLSVDPSPKNPYAASNVTLEMLSILEGKDIRHVYPIDGTPDPIGGSTYDSTNWVLLSLRMQSDSNFNLDSNATSPVVELAVYPFDWEHPDTGTVEIADPELHYFKDGY